MRLFLLLSGPVLVTISPASAASQGGMQEWSADTLHWEEARPGGTQRTILEGDPAVVDGTVTYAFHMPAGTWFPPHIHATTARVFVLRGTLLLGEGNIEDHTSVRRIKAGEVVVVPGSLSHYEGAEGDTVIIGVTTGPFNTRFLKSP